ncbi:expressed unknown protein [Seminavis robusta]|uniref:Uncharacterized protein n=1 Tax=Seminavis robusta TaxID=568900 RepID=A0A9N8DAR3_9STRA|nr:expressed unknown protein [Seminavis robusta]|eukprot:Sro13_g010150.1 n/a (285) ;mRNA; r:127952-128806
MTPRYTTVTFLFLCSILSCAHGFSAQPAATSNSVVTWEVCISPACISDGAHETLETLQALAPPGSVVTTGVCCSLCGNGPVVMNPDDKKPKKHRRVKGQDKILKLLLEDQQQQEEGMAIPESLTEGYQLSRQAEDAFLKKDHEQAVTLYEKSIDIAFRSAMDLQGAREKRNDDTINKNGIPVGLLWLVKARRNEASAKMALGDLEGAVLAAQASCNIARNRCAESLQVLAEIYQKEGNAKGELQALNNLFDLPVDEKSITTQVANVRRELGFRKQKLEREVGGA